MPELTELIRNSIRNAETTVLVPNSLLTSAQACLRSRGFTDDDINAVRWYPIRALDGIWIRDYGMEIIEAVDDGHPVFIDMGYYSGRASSCAGPFPGRPNDDVSPTIFAPDFDASTDIYRPALRTEGGNLQTDGQGTCVHMQREVLARNRFERWSYTQEQLDDQYRNYYQCPVVITLQSFALDPQAGLCSRQVIDHVDMFMTFISPQTVIVAQVDPEDAAFDRVNAQIMENNAETLANAGYNVVRIPQTRRYCTVHRGLNCNVGTCISNPGDARMCDAEGLLDRVWATYANSIRVGNLMMVPVYHDVPTELADAIAAQEQQALEIFQDTLDAEFGTGQVIVTPIVSDRMIPCQGSVHCISMTYK
jgi:agmatine/peptidylarginine deiminase